LLQLGNGNKHGVLGPLLFLLYINNKMNITNTTDNNNKSEVVVFVEDTSLIITSPNPTNFIKEINGAFTDVNSWLVANCH
jgi:hypothetical protein